MTDITPRTPQRPLFWSDVILDLKDYLQDVDVPIYIVGGAVRDAYRHHPIKDLDLATPANAVALGRTIANLLNGDFFIMDAERDVSRVISKGDEGHLVIDIAHFRGKDLLSDLLDRDFTLNAMAVDLQGDLNQLFDPLNGEQDLLDKRIRRCSPQSIADDPLRALRAVRQSVQFGARIDPETLKDIRHYGMNVLDTSAERIRDELFKILSLAEPAKALRVLDTLGFLQLIIPEVEALHDLSQSTPHIYDAWRHTLLVIEKTSGILKSISYQRTDETAATFELGMAVMVLDRFRAKLVAHIQQNGTHDRSYTGLIVLTALLHDIGKPEVWQQDEKGNWYFPEHGAASALLAEKRSKALRLSNDEKKRVVKTIANISRPLALPTLSDLERHRFWYQLDDYGVDVCLLALANYLGTVGVELKQDEWLAHLEVIQSLLHAYYEQYDVIVSPPTLVDGKQLMKTLNLSSGPIIGELLTLIREAQVIGEVETMNDAIELAKAHIRVV